MRSTDHLFQLIKSLTKSEKRHFQLFARRYNRKESVYLALFKAMESMQEYDEDLLREKLKGQKCLTRLSVAKDYLHTLILRSLRDLESEAPEARVMAMVRDAAILIERYQYEPAAKILAKADQLATEYDLMNERMAILDQEAYLPNTDRELLFQKWERILNQMNELLITGKFAESMSKAYHKNIHKAAAQRAEEAKRILSAYSTLQLDTLSTFSAKVRYHWGWTFYYKLLQMPEEDMEHTSAMLDLFHSYPQHINTQQLGYMDRLRAVATRRLREGRRERFLELVERLKKLDVRKEIIPYQRMILFDLEMQHTVRQPEEELITELYERFQILIAEYPLQIKAFDQNWSIKFNLEFAKAFITLSKLEEALQCLMQLSQTELLECYHTDKVTLQLLLLLVHFELGNTGLLPYMLRSFYRSITPDTSINEVERTMLYHIRKLAKATSTQEVHHLFISLQNEINAIPRIGTFTELDQRAFYTDWLESKIIGIPMQQIIQEKRKAQMELVVSKAA